MNEALTLTFAVAVPFLCLGLLLWLARLEDTLTDGLEPATATREPAPVAVNEAVVPATAAA
ncbi:MAG TPA: hypothetical protein VFR87_00160 [Nocardioidaceae bacterium]|nr:hypothetical protein [Nocardioidaceae bacterium]